MTTKAKSKDDELNSKTPDTSVPLAKTLPSLILRKIDGVLTIEKDNSVLGTVKDTPKSFNLKLKTLKPLNKLMPELIASDIQAKVAVSPPNTVSVSASANKKTVEVLPKVLSFDDFSLKLDVLGSQKAEKGSVQLKGVARVGGKNGLTADMDTKIDVTASSASIPLSHKGGWSPIKGVTSPAIKANLKLGVDNKHISLTAKASLPSESVIVPKLLSFVKHPTMGNPSIEVSLEKAAIDSDAKYSVRLKTGLKLGKAGASLPVIGITGEVSPTGEFHADFDTAGGWNPIAVLPGLKTSGIAGNVKMDPSGKVSALVKFAKPVSFALSKGLELSNWSAVATLQKSELVAHVKGKIKIGRDTGMGKIKRKSKNDLILDVQGEINNVQTTLNAKVGDSWQPFNDIVFSTPKMNGKLTIGGDSFLVGSVSGMMKSSLALSIPLLKLKLEAEEEDATGPTFDVHIKKEKKDSSLEINTHFAAKLCTSLIQDSAKRCLPIKMKPLENNQHSISGQYTDGDFNPFANITDRINIHASKESPLNIALTADLGAKSAKLSLQGKMDLDVPLLGKFENQPINIGGQMPLPSVLMTVIDGIKLPIFGKLGPVTFALSFKAHPNVYIPGIDTHMPVKAINVFWKGKSPIPKICNSDLVFALRIGWNPLAPKLLGKVACPRNNVFLKKKIKTINFMSLSAITLAVEIQKRFNKDFRSSFRIGTEISIATGSSLCEEDSVSSQCLSATVEAEVNFVEAKPPLPDEVGVGFDVGFRGVWLNPMGLRNFALVSPHLGLGVTWITGVPLPKVDRLQFDLTILWKRPQQVVPITFTNIFRVYSHLPRICVVTYTELATRRPS